MHVRTETIPTIERDEFSPETRPLPGIPVAGLGEVNEAIAAAWIQRHPLRTTNSVRSVYVPPVMLERVIDPGEVALMPRGRRGLQLVPVNDVTELERARERGMNLLLDEILGGEEVYGLAYYLDRAKALGVEEQFDLLDWLTAWRAA